MVSSPGCDDQEVDVYHEIHVFQLDLYEHRAD